jgi:serine/threonine protein kinase/tetratricopeptide (TPR) repeat protein
MIGQLLGHYRIVEKIGAGGMGEVYRAHDETLDRDVALKVLPIGMLADEAARKRFRKEALALAKLNHPNIETVYEFATQDGVDFLAMELIAGLTLAQKLSDGLLTDQETLRLGTQIAEGLNAAHERGVVHCDLKPGNVMVTANGHAKVLDFGLAKFFHTSKDSSITESLSEMRAAGTLPYMSPEQVRGERVDSRTDIYSAGAVLYEMSTGQRPFPETHGPRLIDAILHQLPLPPSTLNRRLKPSFENVILKALDKDPDCRYQSATELSVDLKRLAISAPLTTAPRRLVMRRFRLPTAISVSVAVLLALAFLGVRNYKISRIASSVPASSVPASMSGIPLRSSGRFVAVLPIQVLGDASQVGYLAQGVQEGLSTRLFQLKGVSVTSSDEARKIDQKQPLTKIARALGANYLVHGTLQSLGDTIRVSLILEDVAQGSRLWSQELSGTKDQLQILDDQASEAVATALGIKASEEELSRSEARETSNVHAYDLYLRGRYSLAGNDVNNVKSALDYFNEALHEDPFFVLPFIGAADAALRMYEVKKDSFWSEKAMTAARAAQVLDDGLPEVHSVLGSAYIATGKYAEGITELKRAISIAPSSDEAYRRLGAAYLASGDYPHAIESFQKAVDLNSYFWVNQNSLGNVHFQSGDYPKALQAFQQVTVLAPDIETGFENMGNVYAQQGKYQEAVTYFQKALQIEPYFTTYSNLGTAYFFLKQYPQAVRMFEKAVELNPNDTAAMANLGDAYRGAGQQQKARATYFQALSLGNRELQINPRNADVLAQMALCYANLADPHQADLFIKKARAIDKSNVGYIYQEAQIYALLGKTQEALGALLESLDKHYPADAAASDPELDSLHGNPEFDELIKKYSAKKL